MSTKQSTEQLSKHVQPQQSASNNPPNSTFIRRSRTLTTKPLTANTDKISRAMSCKRTLCKKITRTKREPQYGSRAKTGQNTLAAKKRVLEKYPGLNIEIGKDNVEELVFQGVNSIRAETIDFYGMVIVMQDNVKMLTHAAVARLMNWIPLFALYLERYLLVEEHFLFKWAEKKMHAIKGELRPSVRMVMHGKIQKAIRDVQETHNIFMPQLPPGERLPKLLEAADIFARLVAEYCVLVSEKLPPLLREHYNRAEVEKAKIKIVKHVVAHSGYQDFVALYTRWMRPGDLLEWKTSILFPCDFKFFSYATWEKDMDAAHYQIAAQFAEVLEDENREAVELNKQSKADFDRAVATRQKMAPFEDLGTDGLTIEEAEETEYSDEDED